MVENYPYRYPEGNQSKKSTGKHMEKKSNPNRYRGKNNQTKNQGLGLESDTDFKGRCSDLEVHIFDLGKRASY